MIAVMPTAPDRLTVIVPASGDQLRPVRERLRAWLAARGVPRDLSQGVVLVTDEALANAIEHGYRDHAEPGSVDLTVRVEPEEVVVRVVDHGSWKPPATGSRGFRGRGLVIIKAMASWMGLVHTDRGTALTASLPR